MSSIQLCAAHQATSGFDGDAIAQYMRTDFITLQEHLSVHEAREHFISQLDSDDIPGQVFVVACRKLRGSCWRTTFRSFRCAAACRSKSSCRKGMSGSLSAT